MKTEFKNTDKELTIDGPNAVPMEDGAVLALLRDCSLMHTVIPLTRFRCRKVDNLYRYTFDAADGRKWKQDLTIPVTGEASQTFDVSDEWKESEYQHHRICRAHCIDLVQRFGVTDIDIQWI